MTTQPTPLECHRAEIALGALVLGALDPAERDQVEAHVSQCPRCTATLAELAPLPGLLHRVDPEQAAAGLPEPPSELLPGLLAAAHEDDWNRAQSRRRRLTIGLTAAAAVLAAVAAGTIVVSRDNPSAPATTVASATNRQTHVSAKVEMTAASTGTEMTLSLSGVAPGERCRLVAVDSRGNREVAATWVATYAGEAHVAGSTSFPRSQIDKLLVVTPDGQTLVSIPSST